MFRSWDRDDIDVAVAWTIEQQLKCGGCGLPRDLTHDKAKQFGFHATAKRCHACKAVADEQKRFTSGPHDPGGLTFSVAEA